VDLFGRGFGNVAPELRPAVFWAWRRTLDLTEKKLFKAPEGAVEELDPMSAAFTFVNWPLELAGKTPEPDPAASLPRALTDRQRLGYTMRNRWKDGDDIVTVFTGFRHPGGDWPCEGAELDLRLLGLGTEWILRGNSSAGDPTTTIQLEGAPDPDEVQQRHYAAAEDGSATVSLAYKLGKDGAGLRSLGVDYSGASGAPALLALADSIKWNAPGKRPPAKKGAPAPYCGAPRWRLVTDSGNQVTPQPDGFSIAGAGGAVLKGVVVSPVSPKVAVEEATHKIEINYRYDHLGGQFTRKVVSFEGGDFVFVLLLMGAGEIPTVSVSGSGKDAVATVGKQTVRFDGEKVRFGVFKGGLH
jgi:hypothetical protein